MTSGTWQIDQPTLLGIFPDGQMTGGSRVYEKYLEDMTDVYLDEASFERLLGEYGPQHLVYSVHDQKYQEGPGALTIGTSTLLPGKVGDEFPVTRGHLHARADRAELYYCLSGRGVMLLETRDGQVSAVELTAGKAVNVPGHWIHRSVNVGSEPFVTLFCYASDAGQDYEIIAHAGGMRSLVLDDGHGGWQVAPNPRHTGYSQEVD